MYDVSSKHVQVNPAAFEISGHIVLKKAEDYTRMNEKLVERLLGCASIDARLYRKLKTAVLSIRNSVY